MKTIKFIAFLPLLLALASGYVMAATAPGNGLGKIETANAAAEQAFLQGWQAYRKGSPQSLASAVRHLERATQLDPEFSQAYAVLGGVYWDMSVKGWSGSLDLNPTQARELSRVNLVTARQQPSALSYRFSAETAAHFNRKATKALAEAGQALELDASDPAGHLAMAAALLKAKKPDEAAKSMRTAMNLDPDYPAFYLNRLGQAEFAMGQYENAAKSLQKATELNPEDDWTFVYLAAAYGHLGRDQAAKDAVETANLLRSKAGWGNLTLQTIGSHRDSGGRRYFVNWLGDYKSLRAGLRKAGVAHEASWHSLIVSDPAGTEVKGATTIDIETAKALHERGVPFVDIWFLWPKGHISGSHFLDAWAYEFNDATLPRIAGKKQEVVIYSSRAGGDGRWTAEAIARAVSWGYEKIYFFRNGIDTWKAAGYPLETAN